MYDMVTQSWILHGLKMYNILNQDLQFMQTWRVKLTADEKRLAEVKIQRDIF